jgi:hypothetical protein
MDIGRGRSLVSGRPGEQHGSGSGTPGWIDRPLFEVVAFDEGDVDFFESSFWFAFEFGFPVAMAGSGRSNCRSPARPTARS